MSALLAAKGMPGICIWDQKVHNVNNVELTISNFGMTGPGYWPKGSGHNYLFGAGLWFGSVDTVSRYYKWDTLVTIGYGPHGGESEFAPGLRGSDPTALPNRIYMFPDPWPAPAESFPMAPQDTVSHQDSWCCYNDCDSAYHMPGDTRPIGIEVYQTGYAWNLPWLEDMIFLCYTLKNVSGRKLTRCRIGFCIDADIGNESGTGNDIVWCIIHRWYKFNPTDSLLVDDLAYQWQEAEEPGWDRHPGVIGVDLLQTPFDLKPGADKDHDNIPDEHERDSAYYVTNLPPEKWDVDGDFTPDWRDPSEIPQTGMSVYKRFTLNLEPNRDNERYLTLAGYNFKTHEYCPWDTLPPAPDDQRFLMACGPFELLPDSSVTIVMGIIFAEWFGRYGRPDTAIAIADYYGQMAFDRDWLTPSPPAQAGLLCVPGDKKVTLVWDERAENTADPYYQLVHNADPNSPGYDPYYREYDFQGYRVWKSRTAKKADWELLAAFDLDDGITFVDSAMTESLRLRATDNGLVHSYVDNDVQNGFLYYYAVTAFDYNYVKTDTPPQPPLNFRPIWLENGIISKCSAIPRREAANYRPPGIPVDSTVAGAPLLDSLVTAIVTNPLDVDPDQPLYVKMAAPEYYVWTETDTFNVTKRYSGAIYRIFLKNARGMTVDSIRSWIKIGAGYSHSEFIACQGLSITCGVGTPVFPASAVNLFGDVLVPTSGYPETLLVPEVLSPVPNFENSPNYSHGFWAYRGHDYTVTWHVAGGKSRTVTVVDAATGDTIPFYAFKNDSITAPDGACWCFTANASLSGPFAFIGTDTLEYRGPYSHRTKSLYIMGGQINLHRGVSIDSLILPADGEIWTVKANEDYLPPSVAGSVIVQGQPGYFDTAPVTLNVKVVPNPYVVNNSWQQSSLIRRLRFINLPNRCTIRLFNLNGELVKTLFHKETTPVGKGVVNNAGGDEWWNLLNEYGQLIASGIYVFHVESAVGEQVGKFAVIR
jgi:hypothetical protein